MCELLSQNDILRRMKLKKQAQTTLFLHKSVKHKVYLQEWYSQEDLN